jgi:hypothetical protein
MRKTLLLFFILLNLGSFAQSITVEKLNEVLKAKTAEIANLLGKNGFKLHARSAGPNYYYSDNKMYAESVVTGLGFTNKALRYLPQLGYYTDNTRYVDQLIREIKVAGFQLTNTKQAARYEFSRYKNKDTVILVTKRTDGSKSRLYFMQLK